MNEFISHYTVILERKQIHRLMRWSRKSRVQQWTDFFHNGDKTTNGKLQRSSAFLQLYVYNKTGLQILCKTWWVYVDVCGPCYQQILCRCPWSMMTPKAILMPMDCFLLRTMSGSMVLLQLERGVFCWCLCPMSSPKAMQMSVVCAEAWTHVDVCRLF